MQARGREKQRKFFVKKPDRTQRAKKIFNSAKIANVKAFEADGTPDEPDSDAWYTIEGDQGEEEEEEEEDASVNMILISQSTLDAMDLEASNMSAKQVRVALVMTDSECLLDSGAGMSLAPTAAGANRVWDERTRLILPSGESYDCTQRCTIMETPYLGGEAQSPIAID